jgi:Asp-tRNA(Asn)/Glu-tRNA(Gln) amidotransferase A subunit family amidase
MFYFLAYLKPILSLFYRNYDKYFVQSQRVRRGVVNDYKKVFEEDKIDCLLAPVVSDDPITLAEYERSDDIFSEDDIFTVGVNLAGTYSRICERFYLFLILF